MADNSNTNDNATTTAANPTTEDTAPMSHVTGDQLHLIIPISQLMSMGDQQGFPQSSTPTTPNNRHNSARYKLYIKLKNLLKKEIDAKNNDIQQMRVERRKTLSQIKTLNRTIIGLKKDLQDKNDIITEKEKSRYEVVRTMGEMNKVNRAQHGMIEELEKQIKWMADQIDELMADAQYEEEKHLKTLKKASSKSNKVAQLHQHEKKLPNIVVKSRSKATSDKAAKENPRKQVHLTVLK